MRKDEYKIMYEMEERNWWFVAKRKLVSCLIEDFAKGKKILDVGCGTGINLLEFEKFGYVIGCDFSKQALKFCKTRGKNSLILSDASFLPLGKHFDIILALDLIEHCKDDKKAIREFYRILKKGGILILTVPAIKFLFGEHDKALHHFRRYSKRELENKLKEIGFKIEKISYWNIFLFPAIFLYRLFTKYLSSKKQSDRTPGFSNEPLLFISAIENKIIRSFNFPLFGTSIVCVARKL